MIQSTIFPKIARKDIVRNRIIRYNKYRKWVVY